jgi:putative peptidoglycan lipid II flippase
MVDKILKFKTEGIGAIAIILAVSALVSRLLALVRDRILAGQFGAGAELDVYFAAFRVPDLVFGVLVMGGISAAFLPIFSEYFQKSAEQGWKFANNALNCFLILLILTCLVLAIFIPLLVKFIAPGFSPEQEYLLISLTRIMFLSPIFFGLSSIFSGIAHYFNRFLFYSIAPIIYNLSIIFGILFLVPIFGLYGLAYGVVLGAFFHWLIQIPVVKASGFKYSTEFNFKSLAMKKFFKLMLPRVIGVVAIHINLIVVTAIASTLAVGSIAIFNFANNLQYIPIGLIGASFAVASFPALSRIWVNGQKDEFLKKFSSIFRQILFLIIPASFLIFLLRAQIVRIILGTGRFSWWETELTAASLGIFSVGIFALALIPFLTKVFFSFQNTKIPTKAGLYSVALNIPLAFFFVWTLAFPNTFQSFIVNFLDLQEIQNIAVIGLPLALSISAIFQFFLLCFFLKKEVPEIDTQEIFKSFQKIFFISTLMSIFTYLTLHIIGNIVDMKTFLGVFTQMTSAGIVAMFSYFSFSLLFKLPESMAIRRKISLLYNNFRN